MNSTIDNTYAIAVVGGVYRERCMRPAWQEVYGSAGRAASAMAAMGIYVELHTYYDSITEPVLISRAAIEGFKFSGESIPKSTLFDYDHGLAAPRIYSFGCRQSSLRVQAEQVLRFGMLEGSASVHGKRVVYDPQSPAKPEPFHQNGSTADELALILNYREARLLSGGVSTSADSIAKSLILDGHAQVVVIKCGPLGALVHDGKSTDLVPAYRSRSVWKIGSGDNFAAHFALRWMEEGKSAAESADLASRATAYYCQSKGFAIPKIFESFTPEAIVPSEAFRKGRRPVVYLAGPFFTLAQLWIVEQARKDLTDMGLEVFSPYHDVGCGSADDVVMLDLVGIEKADIIFAIGDGMDSGTIYEIGYARAKDKPVIVYCENESEENKKMMQGSSCHMCDDYVSAIYHAVWTACSL
ncbi:PfkB family carbohydrate kinase [Methylomonas sp. MV1]|uniref:PfkB family carbohydrate kinase n=1 Tax=Methylomonas sp. MV1 TaxID=3073620 RepID=UPI0028A41070|nr:PfkB family carbohydrate kinase [Methylomonas sp. MV1]MDT4332996.1 PfkB family carbohydrate kinase [Methylomonas sp. MV1]